MELLSVLLIVVLQLAVNVCKISANDPMNSFIVTWAQPNDQNPYAFNNLPKTSQDAKAKQWKMLDNGCNDASKGYSGSRYYMNGSYGVMPIYDCNGRVAGIQMTIPKSAADKNNVVAYQNLPVMHQETINRQTVYTMTAYFSDPGKICKPGRTDTDGTLSQLWLQEGKTYLGIPRTENTTVLASQNWTKGNCVATMGTHYYRYMCFDMDCAKMYPVFLMYDCTQNPPTMNGFGFFPFGNYSCNRFEYPPANSLGKFFTPEPTCLQPAYSKAGGLTVLHVFFCDRPQNVTC